jgi:hypothetical protein
MPKHRLSKEQTAVCKGCRHGRAAHKGACRMKHCKCEAFK